MHFTEKQIERVFDSYADSDLDITADLEDIVGKQPALIAYLAQENFELLSEAEYDYMIFLAAFIWNVYRQEELTIRTLDASIFDVCEESNWEILNAAGPGKFSQRIDGFYEDFPQEELLSFIEDALTEDDLPIVTKEGREPMFIILKTVIDIMEESIR